MRFPSDRKIIANPRTLILILMAGPIAVCGVSLLMAQGIMPQEGEGGIEQYLPDEQSLDGWTASEPPQIAGAEELFLLIDGGAEIFREYGFEQTVFSSYQKTTESGDTKSINLEIYVMNNPASAFGIYTYRTSERGESISIGTCGRLEGYYMNFWKGRFCVSLIGLDPDSVTMAGVGTIAKAVAAGIRGESEKPRLLDLLPVDDLKPNGIEYLRGNLALYDNYRFSSENIFGVTEGAIGTYGDHTVFLFSYADERESRKWFENGMARMVANPDFSGYTPRGHGYSLRDGKGNWLRFEQCRNYIIVTLGTKESSRAAIVSQKQRIEISPPSRYD